MSILIKIFVILIEGDVAQLGELEIFDRKTSKMIAISIPLCATISQILFARLQMTLPLDTSSKNDILTDARRSNGVYCFETKVLSLDS